MAYLVSFQLSDCWFQPFQMDLLVAAKRIKSSLSCCTAAIARLKSLTAQEVLSFYTVFNRSANAQPLGSLVLFKLNR